LQAFSNLVPGRSDAGALSLYVIHAGDDYGVNSDDRAHCKLQAHGMSAWRKAACVGKMDAWARKTSGIRWANA